MRAVESAPTEVRFNRVNFPPPNGNRSTAGFGTITSTYDPRQVQLGVKVIW